MATTKKTIPKRTVIPLGYLRDRSVEAYDLIWLQYYPESMTIRGRIKRPRMACPEEEESWTTGDMWKFSERSLSQLPETILEPEWQNHFVASAPTQANRIKDLEAMAWGLHSLCCHRGCSKALAKKINKVRADLVPEIWDEMCGEYENFLAHPEWFRARLTNDLTKDLDAARQTSRSIDDTLVRAEKARNRVTELETRIKHLAIQKLKDQLEKLEGGKDEMDS